MNNVIGSGSEDTFLWDAGIQPHHISGLVLKSSTRARIVAMLTLFMSWNSKQRHGITYRTFRFMGSSKSHTTYSWHLLYLLKNKSHWNQGTLNHVTLSVGKIHRVHSFFSPRFMEPCEVALTCRVFTKKLMVVELHIKLYHDHKNRALDHVLS